MIIKMIIKRSKKVNFSILFLFLWSAQSYAEGQDGLTAVYRIGYFFGALLFITLYTILGGVLFTLIFRKSNLKQESQLYRPFLISFLIVLLITIVFRDNFIFFFWNVL
jgi:hypothetical protein